MLNPIKNKKGATEGITWIVGLIAILFIVVLSIIIYNYGGLGKKTLVEIATSKYSGGGNVDVVLNTGSADFFNVLAGQRLNAFFLSSDLSGVNKGMLIGDISGYVKLGYNERVDFYYSSLDSRAYSIIKNNPNFDLCSYNSCFYLFLKDGGYSKIKVKEANGA